MARDVYHDIVKAALEKDGWTITDDPLTILGIGIHPYHIDIGAEKIIAAERLNEKIAVEVKSFIGKSFSQDFHEALGQYMNYLIALEHEEPNRILFLAVPSLIYEAYFETHHIINVIKKVNLKIIVFDENEKILKQWIK